MAEPVIFIHCYDYEISDYAIWSFTAEGVFVNKWTTPEWPQENCMCVDSSHNVYMVDMAGGPWNVIKKWDKNGQLLKSKTTDWTEGIAIGPDGYLYTRQLDGGNKVIVKRDLSDLTLVSQMDIDSIERAFTFDSDGYFYVLNGNDIEKWAFGDAAKTVSRTIGALSKPSAAYADGLIGLCSRLTDVSTIPIALDEDLTAWGLGDPRHIAAIGDEFVVAEYDSSDEYYKLRKYSTGGTLLWSRNIEHTDNITVYGVGAYPFAREEEAQPIISLIG